MTENQPRALRAEVLWEKRFMGKKADSGKDRKPKKKKGNDKNRRSGEYQELNDRELKQVLENS